MSDSANLTPDNATDNCACRYGDERHDMRPCLAHADGFAHADAFPASYEGATWTPHCSKSPALREKAARDAALCRTCNGTGELEAGLSAIRCPDCRSQAAPADLRALKKGSDGPDGPQPMTDDERAMRLSRATRLTPSTPRAGVFAGFDAGFRAGWRGALRWANKADAPVHVFSPPNLDNDAAAAADPTPYRDVWCDCGSDGFCLNSRASNGDAALRELRPRSPRKPRTPPLRPRSQPRKPTREAREVHASARRARSSKRAEAWVGRGRSCTENSERRCRPCVPRVMSGYAARAGDDAKRSKR